MAILKPSLRLYLVWGLACMTLPSFAQTNKLFQWGFSNNLLSTQLPTCNPLPIVVKSFDPTTNATNGTPPYYMISYGLGGTTVTTLLGSDESKLSWTVTQPVGSRLILAVVDANGSSGGVTPRVMTVIPGQTTQCVVQPQTTPEFSMTANVTADLNTCQPWGLTVKGGVPPYIITLLQPNSPVVTNASIGLGDDRFTYINRADTGSTLVAAISDLTGRWASGAVSVNTKGPADVSCTGLVSSSGNSTIIEQQTQAALVRAVAEKKRQGIVIGVSVALSLLFLAGGAVLAVLYLRRRHKKREEEDANVFPEQFVSPPSVVADGYKAEGMLLSINSYIGSDAAAMGSTAPLSRAQLKAQEAFGTIAAPPVPPKLQLHSRVASAMTSMGPPLSTYQSSQSDNNSVNGRYTRPGFSSFPSTSIRQSAKAAEANGGAFILTNRAPGGDSDYSPLAPDTPRRQRSADSAFSNSGDSIGPLVRSGPPGIRRRPTLDGFGEDNGRVIQHEDGGVPGELPPPYMAKTGGGGPGRSS